VLAYHRNHRRERLQGALADRAGDVLVRYCWVGALGAELHSHIAVVAFLPVGDPTVLLYQSPRRREWVDQAVSLLAGKAIACQQRLTVPVHPFLHDFFLCLPCLLYSYAC